MDRYKCFIVSMMNRFQIESASISCKSITVISSSISSSSSSFLHFFLSLLYHKSLSLYYPRQSTHRNKSHHPELDPMVDPDNKYDIHHCTFHKEVIWNDRYLSHTFDSHLDVMTFLRNENENGN